MIGFSLVYNPHKFAEKYSKFHGFYFNPTGTQKWSKWVKFTNNFEIQQILPSKSDSLARMIYYLRIKRRDKSLEFKEIPALFPLLIKRKSGLGSLKIPSKIPQIPKIQIQNPPNKFPIELTNKSSDNLRQIFCEFLTQTTCSLASLFHQKISIL